MHKSQRYSGGFPRLLASVVATSLLVAFAAGVGYSQVDLVRKTLKKVDENLKKTDPSSQKADNKLPATKGNGGSGQVGSRLIFSKQPIDPESPRNLTTSFNAGDHIYGLLILPGPVKEFVRDQYVRDSTKGYSVTRPGFEVDFQIDGSPMFDGLTKFVFQLEQKEGALDAVPTDHFLIFDIAPEASKARTYGYEKMYFPLLTAVGRRNNKAKAGAQFYSFHIGKLGAGDHTVSLTFSGSERVTGEFSISGSNFAFYKKLADEMDNVAAANAIMPKPVWSNASVTGSVARAYRKVGSETVVRTVLISPSWFVQRNSLGFIVHRGLFAVIATRTAGGECYMQKEYFKQTYRGRRYGPTRQDGRSETRQRIPCENVYK